MPDHAHSSRDARTHGIENEVGVGFVVPNQAEAAMAFCVTAYGPEST